MLSKRIVFELMIIVLGQVVFNKSQENVISETVVGKNYLETIQTDLTTHKARIIRESNSSTQSLRSNGKDLCAVKHCEPGHVCQISKNQEAECLCIEKCEEEVDPRRKVCTNHNETFGSDCEVYQARCFCDTHDSRCRGQNYRHVHIDYYGECKQIPICKEEDGVDFPRRMRNWLFNVMSDLANRQELTQYFLKKQRAAESDHTLRWSAAAIWKFCDLDIYPYDRAVSKHELFPIRASLLALEHCIVPFLDSCDTDNDHKITLKEWGKCLEIKEEELDEECDDLVVTFKENKDQNIS